MLKYTRAAIDIIIRDLKRCYFIFKYTLAALMIGYYVFAIFMNIGNRIVNIVLASLYVVYIIVDFFISRRRRLKKVVKHTYAWLRLLIKAISLGMTLYAMYTATESVNPLAIILTSLMIILWTLQFLFEIILLILEAKIELLYEAIEMDKENAKKPITSVAKFFKNLAGKEINETPISRNEQRIIEEAKRKKKNKKNKSSTD